MDSLEQIRARIRVRGGTGTQYPARLGSVRITNELDAWVQSEVDRRAAAGQPYLTSDIVRDVLSAAAMGLCGDVSLLVNASDLLTRSPGARAQYVAAVKAANAATRRHR